MLSRPPRPGPPRPVDLQRPAAICRARPTRRSPTRDVPKRVALAPVSAALRAGRHERPRPRERDRGAARLSGRGADARWREIALGEWAGRVADGLPGRDRGRVARRSADAGRRRIVARVRPRVGGAVDELVAAGGDVARRLPRRRRPRGALPHHRRRRRRRSPGRRTRASPSFGALAASRALRLDARLVSDVTSTRFAASSLREGPFQKYSRSHPGAFDGRLTSGNRPAGTMGPPCRPVTPNAAKPLARIVFHQGSTPGSRSTPSSLAARTHGLTSVDRDSSAGGGVVSRRNCSIAAMIAAASSGEAVLPWSSSRARRFIDASVPVTGGPRWSRSRAGV